MSKVNPLVVAARFAKTAGNPAAPPALPTVDQLNQAHGLRDVGNVGLMALGAGAGLRGLMGLYNLVKHKVSPPTVKYPGALVTRVPIPVEDDDDEPGVVGRRRKTASLAATPEPSGVTDYTHQWWYPMGMVGAGAAGLYGGFKGLDWLLERRRRSTEKQDIDDSRNDFEKALLESYSKPRRPSGLNIPPEAKLAGDQPDDAEKLSSALDELYDKLREKKADWKDWYTLGGAISPDTAQQFGGGYLGFYALPSALLTGKLVYDQSAKTNESSILQKAMARRQRMAARSRPSEILAVPEEVRVGNRFGDEADNDAAMNPDPSEPMDTRQRNRKIIRGIL